MSTSLSKGHNGDLAVGEVRITVQLAAPADVSALLVTDAGKVRSDADFVFFNQPEGPGVRLRQGQAGQAASLAVTFAQIPAVIAQVRAVITLDDAASSFGQFAAPVADISDAAGNVLYSYRIDGLSSESIVIAVELYRRGVAWKVRAVGQGYAGGFAALVTDHGVSVDDGAREAAPTATPAPPAPVGVRTVPSEAKLSLDKRQKLDMRKKQVAEVLSSKGASGVRARIVLVIDKTGSMIKQYRAGVVHRVVERMVPVATQIDDDGKLEPYMYARHFLKPPEIEVHTAEEWAQTFVHLGGTRGGLNYDSIGHSNDEIPIMSEIISTLRPGDRLPTLVLFFTDGGFAKRDEIRQLMRHASSLPAFWQFVGLGRANYGLLRQLDELDGRMVDNAGFFELDDIDSVDDAELYQRLLSEFPSWVTAARAEGVIGA
ncbi:MAG: vWA domain-containing protein [Mycobacterium sp.]